MTVPQSGASRASPAPEWLTRAYARRILDPITFPGDAPPAAVVSPEAAAGEATS